MRDYTYGRGTPTTASRSGAKPVIGAAWIRMALLRVAAGLALACCGEPAGTRQDAAGAADARSGDSAAPDGLLPPDGAVDGMSDGSVDGLVDSGTAPDIPVADARIDAAPPCSTLVLRPTFSGILDDPAEYASCSSGGVTFATVRTYDSSRALLDERTIPCTSDTVRIDYLPPGDYSFGLRATLTAPTPDRVAVAGWHPSCPTPNSCTDPNQNPCRLVCGTVPACAEETEAGVELLCSNTESGGADLCAYI
jgi:hypothetical protein